MANNTEVCHHNIYFQHLGFNILIDTLAWQRAAGWPELGPGLHIIITTLRHAAAAAAALPRGGHTSHEQGINSENGSGKFYCILTFCCVGSAEEW